MSTNAIVTVGDLENYLRSFDKDTRVFPTSNRIEGQSFRYVCLEWAFDDIQFALDNDLPT